MLLVSIQQKYWNAILITYSVYVLVPMLKTLYLFSIIIIYCKQTHWCLPVYLTINHEKAKEPMGWFVCIDMANTSEYSKTKACSRFDIFNFTQFQNGVPGGHGRTMVRLTSLSPQLFTVLLSIKLYWCKYICFYRLYRLSNNYMYVIILYFILTSLAKHGYQASKQQIKSK